MSNLMQKKIYIKPRSEGCFLQTLNVGCAITFIVIALAVIIVIGALRGNKQTEQSSAQTNDTVVSNQKTEMILKAEEFIGMTCQRMLSLMGQPLEVTTGSHPSDGSFKLYNYSKEKGKETYFTIWDSDGIIDNGMYKGTYFYKKTPPEEATGQKPRRQIPLSPKPIQKTTPETALQPFDVLTLSNAELPKTTKLKLDVNFAIAGGSGFATAAAGSQVKVLSRNGKLIEVGYLDGKNNIPYTQTTVEADVVRIRENLRLREVERLDKVENARIERELTENQEAERREQTEKQEAENKAARQKLIKAQFSAWDGSHSTLTKAIKKSMNDPDSYKHDETKYIDQGAILLVTTSFRGKNAFGAVVRETVTAKVDLQGNVLEVIGRK